MLPTMKCAECVAFESAFKAAGIKYAELLRDATFRKLAPEAIAARDDYKMSKEDLRVHREGHKKPLIVSEDLKRSG